MPWPWNRPKSPFGFADSEDATSSTSSSITAGTSSNEVASSRSSVSMTNRNTTPGRQTTASRSTTPTPALAASRSSTSRANSAQGFHNDVGQSKPQNVRRNSRDAGNVGNGNFTTSRRAASVIPEEHAVQPSSSRSASSGVSGTPNIRPTRRASTSAWDLDRRTAHSPELLSNPQPSVESLSSVSSSLHSDTNYHGKRSLSASSQLNIYNAQGFSNGRAFSPTPSVGSITHQTSVTRSQKAIIPPGSRQSNTSEDQVFIYELPESYEQVNGLNSHEIEERDLRHKAVVDLNPVPTHARTRSGGQSRESMLEAEVARLKKVVEKYKRTSVNNTSSSSIGSVDHLIIPDVAAAAAGSSEAHRVVKIMKVANEHLQKKIDARDAMLADRLAELEQIHNHHAIEVERQKHGYQVQMQQMTDLHRREMEDLAQRNTEHITAMERDMAQSASAIEGQQRDVEKIAALQAEIEGLKHLERSRVEGYSATIAEVKLKAAEELATAKRKFDEAEERWEIKTEEMRREFVEKKDCNCKSEDATDVIEQLKREHEMETMALKTSIRILEGSRGTTVEQIEEDQRIYRKVSELEASLASKVRALAAERKTSERLRASLVAAEEAGSDIQLQKEWAAEKENYELALEQQKATVFQFKEQHVLNSRQFDTRIMELIKEHTDEKNRIEAAHREMENKLEETIEHNQDNFEKEKEKLIAEYQAILTSISEEKAASHSEIAQLKQSLVEAEASHRAASEEFNSTLEERLRAANEDFEVRLLESQRAQLQEKQTLCRAVEEARAQMVHQQNALESRLQAQLQEAEQQFLLQRESEKNIEATKLQATKAEIEKNRSEYQAEIERLQNEHTQTKDRAAEVVADLQRQLKDEEESKQQLLDRVTKAEAEKETLESELTGVKARFDGANTALSERMEDLRKAEAQVKSLTEDIQALKAAIESERQNSTEALGDLRSQLQSREKSVNDLHAKHQNEVEELQFQIRTAQTKLEIDSVEIESLKETIREKEEALNSLREEKQSSGSSWVEEKRNLVTKHNQIIEGHLSTIAKLEDLLNKMRARSNEEAVTAEAKAAEQQGLVAQWVSSSNRKTDEAQRLERAWKEAQNKAESFKLDVKALKNDLKQYEKESKDQKAEIKSLMKELKAAEEEKSSLKSQMESSSSSSDRHAQKITVLATNLQALTKEIQETKTELSSHKRTLAKRESTIRQLEDALQQQRGGIRNGRASPSPNSALTSMENGIVPSTSSMSSLQRDLRDSRAEVTRLTEKLEMYEKEYRHFFEDHEKMKVEHEEGQRSMKAKLDACLPEMEQLRKVKRDLETQLQSAELRLAASGGLIRRGLLEGERPAMRSQSSMSYLRHGEMSVGSLDA